MFFYLIFKIWQGESAGTLIYSDTIPTENLAEGWNTVEIDPPLAFNTDEELWIGYECDYPIPGFPHGIDAGPAVAGFGDMFKCEDDDWVSLFDMGYDNNFNLRMYLADTTGREIQVSDRGQNKTRNLTGFNLYRSVDGDDYVLIDMITYIDGETQYPVPMDADGVFQCYKMTAVWESETDYCESVPFPSKNNPDEDFVCFQLVGEKENQTNKDELVNIFPNPANSRLAIQSTVVIQEVSLVNLVGQTVISIKANKEQNERIDLNTSSLEDGIYIVKVKTDLGTINRKILIHH